MRGLATTHGRPAFRRGSEAWGVRSGSGPQRLRAGPPCHGRVARWVGGHRQPLLSFAIFPVEKQDKNATRHDDPA